MWLERNGEWIERAAAEPWATKGWQVKTDQQRADYLAAQQAAADAATVEAALLATLPVQFATGIAVPIPNESGHWMLIHPVADGEPVIALQVSNSPLDPAKFKQLKAAALARYQAAKAADKTERDELKAKLAAVESDVAAIKAKETKAAR